MTDTAAVADAAEAAVEAVADAAEAAVEAVADAAEHDDDTGSEGTPAVVAVNPEGAHDDEVQLDHEHRLTLAETEIARLRDELASRPSYEEVRAMTPDPVAVAQEAAAVAAVVAEEAVEEHDDDEHDDDDDQAEGDAETDIEISEPDNAPPVSEDVEPKARGIRW